MRGLGLSILGGLFLLGCQSQIETAEVPTPASSTPSPINPIYVNQHGFSPNSPKLAFYRAELDTPIAWTLHNKSGEIVLNGQTEPVGYSVTADQHLNKIDFSDFDTLGQDFYLTVEGVKGPTFDIAKGLYRSLKFDALAYFYHARAGEEITTPYVAEEHARPAGHMNEIVTCFKGTDKWGTEWPSCDYELDVTGGWYDAGDHGKYVVNSGISTWTLLNAYEHFGEDFADGKVNIPEAGNGVNDLLDEARKNISWMLSMQVPEGTTMKLPIGLQDKGKPLTLSEVDASGMVHHKVHDEKWTDGTTMPHQAQETRYLYPPSTGATLNLAAIGAQCARIFKSIDAQFAGECLEASQKAMEAAIKNPEIFGYNNFDGGGPYGDTVYADELYWSRSEKSNSPNHINFSFMTTSDKNVLKEKGSKSSNFETTNNLILLSSDMGFNNTRLLGQLTNALRAPNYDEKTALQIKSRTETGSVEHLKSPETIIFRADTYLAKITQEKLHFPLYSEKYKWGGNSKFANRAIVIGTAYQLTGEKKYRDGVVHLMDYLLGRNPMGVSYVTGYGDKPFKNPHHRFWAKSIDPTRPDPPAGVLSGGPNNDNMADPVAKEIEGACAAQTCWVDDHGAWSLNEVTINWNAPLFWMAAFLDATEED